MKTKGLSYKTNIVKKLIDHSLNYCVLVSDGVWDVLSPDEVPKLIQNKKVDDMA